MAAYQPLATKYRPQTFADVVGQDVVSTTLRNALKQGRISHAYLFSGMRGVGKTTTARLLAKCLNCLSFDEPTTEPCGTCESCVEVSRGRSIDVLEIDAASNTSVDDVRALQENLIYAPARDRYKVYIVDEVHMLSKSAFNAFLKTLEEPPEHVVFIFATTEMNRIPPTVLSRCLVFDFGRVSGAAIADRLRWICEQEEVSIDDAAVDLIVFQSEGSIRDAISALDQVINFAGGEVTYDHALSALGLIDREVLHTLMAAVIDTDAAAAFEQIRKVSEIGAEMRLFCRHLIRHVRDLLVARVGGADRNLLPYSEEETALLVEQSNQVSEEDLNRFFDILVKADEEMQLAATPQYHLEAALVKMIHSTRLTPLVELISALQSGDMPAPRAQPRPVEKEQSLSFNEKSKPKPPPAPTSGGSPKDRLLHAARNTPLHSPLRPARNIELREDLLTITVTSSGQVKMLTSDERKSLLLELARKTFGENTKVEVKNGGVQQRLTEEKTPDPDAGSSAAASTSREAPEPPRDDAPPPDDADAPAETAEDEQQTAYSRNARHPDNRIPEERKQRAIETLRKDPVAGRLFDELDADIQKIHTLKEDEE